MKRLVWRAVRGGARWWWQQARPSTGADLRGRGEARPPHETGRAPTPDERWLPSAPTTGPWAGVDPHSAGRWPRRASLGAVVLWGAMVGWRVRRDVRSTWPGAHDAG